MKLRNTMLGLSLGAVSLLGCQGALTDTEAVVDNGTSYLTVGEETGELGGDAVGGESDGDLLTITDESSELPEVTDGATGICNFGERRQAVIAKYDTDGDGKLGQAEAQQLRQDIDARIGHPFAARFAIRHRIHVLKRLAWVFDENFDGKLSPEERTALRDALEARCERRYAAVLEKFDANKDGTLDQTERQAAKEAFVARVQAWRAELLTTYDKNGNGALDPSERLSLRADRYAAFMDKRSDVIARFDADKNGRLSQGELLALKQAIQQRIIEGKDAE